MTEKKLTNEERLANITKMQAEVITDTMTPAELKENEDNERLGQRLVAIETQIRELRELKATLTKEIKAQLDPVLDDVEARVESLRSDVNILSTSEDQLIARLKLEVKAECLTFLQQRAAIPNARSGAVIQTDETWRIIGITSGLVIVGLIAWIIFR